MYKKRFLKNFVATFLFRSPGISYHPPPPETTYLKMNDVTSIITVQRSDTELDHQRNNVGKSDEKTESV